jgi:hypothetical protein
MIAKIPSFPSRSKYPDACNIVKRSYSRTLLAAAFALTLIMIGAITIHLHNRDAFSDSLEALHLLILLACIVLIRLLGQRVLGRPHEAKVAYRE